MLSLTDKQQRIYLAFRRTVDTDYKYAVAMLTENQAFIEELWGFEELKPGEFWQLDYTYSDSEVTFAPRESWVKVERSFEAVLESKSMVQQTKLDAKESASLVESAGKRDDGAMRIKAIGLTAEQPNKNNRLYSESAVKKAVAHWEGKFRDSSGQGRLLGEVEHAEDKVTTGIPSLNEVAIRWDSIKYNESTKQVELEGVVLPTEAGKNLQVLIEHGVQIGVSQRAYGKGLIDSEGRTRIIDFDIKGYDAVINPSDANGSLTALLESIRDKDMKLAELKALLEAHKAVLGDIVVTEETVEATLASVRSLLKLNESDDIAKKLEELSTLETNKLQHRVAVELVKGDETLNEALKVGYANFDEAKTIVDRVISDRNALAEAEKAKADAKLKDLGYKGDKQMTIEHVTPVSEKELGIPEFASGLIAIRESAHKRGALASKDVGLKKLHPAAQKMLEAYFTKYQAQITVESEGIRKFNEAGTVSDLATPVLYAGGLIAEFFPKSVAASIFDVKSVPGVQSNFSYKTYTREAGAVVTQAAIAFNNGAWETPFVPAAVNAGKALPKLSGKTITNLVIGSVAFSGGFVEGTDFSVDYRNGVIYTLSAGFAAAVATTTIAFQYFNIDNGEMLGIEKVKMTTTLKPVTLRPSRLAVEFSNESVMWAKYQLGYDILSDAIQNGSSDLARNFDRMMYYAALAAALSVASNKVTYSMANAIDNVTNGLTVRAGAARLALEKRFYPVDELKFVMDSDLAEMISNATMFQNASARPDAALMGTGYVMNFKGMPVYRSTEFGAVSGSKRFALVTHPEQAQALFLEDMKLEGPFTRFDANGKPIGSKNYYMELWDAIDTPIVNKASVVEITA